MRLYQSDSLENTLSIALILFLSLVALISSLRTFYIPGRAPMLFRVLFPSWRFFEDACDIPALYFRLAHDKDNFGPWTRCTFIPERRWSALFINAEGNLALACNTLINQLQNDIEELEESKNAEFVESVSYKLIRNLVLNKIAESPTPTQFSSFQFKVSTLQHGAQEVSTGDILISPLEQLT